MENKSKMQQNVNITGSQNVTVIQAGGDVFGQAGKTVKLSPDREEEVTKSYLGFIARSYLAIHCLDTDVSLTMDNYIPLQLGEEKKEERPKTRREEEPKETRDIDSRVWRKEHSSGQIHSLTPVDIWRAIQNKKIVIKGNPGAGKTTLCCYLAYSLSTKTAKEVKSSLLNLIPLVIDLRDWADKGDISFLDYYVNYVLKNKRWKDEIRLLIEEWVISGKCIILCDGLDEVTSNKKALIQSLEDLTSGEDGNCHILVTTRIVGYANELSGWKHYEIMPLKKENIEQYANDYLKGKGSSFLSALKNTPQIELLSKNPLLLQILCFVFDKQKLVLPTRRVELYKKAVNKMLERKDHNIPSSVKKNVLQEIAFSFLEQGKEVFEEGDLRETIKDYLFKAKESYSADEVLKEIVKGSGLLSRFDGNYGFLYLTFEEYLCACYLAESQEDPCRILEPVLFNPRFHEVVRLTAAMLPKEKASGFIEFIYNQKPPYCDVLHQPLLLAGMCIADIPDDKADISLEKEIVGELLGLWKKTQITLLREEINRVFVAMVGTRNGEEIINRLLGLLKKDGDVRAYAAEALGKLGRADDRVIKGLLRLLKKDEDVRVYAAEALGNLGRADDRVVKGLLGLFKDEDEGVHWYAAEALGKLGWADDGGIDELLGLLKNKDVYVRWDVSEILGRLGRADERVIGRLLGLIKDEDEGVRGIAAKTLGKLGRADEDERVIDGLFGLLEDDGWRVRGNAAEALGKLGWADERVIGGLLGLLKDKNEDVRGYTAEALGKLGRADERVIGGLLGLLKDKNEDVRSVATEALGNLGRADKKVIDGLLRLLKDKNEDVRSAATEALGNLGRADKKVIDGLLRLIEDEYSFVRVVADSALSKLGRTNDRVIDRLLGLLKDENPYVREKAAIALSNLGQIDDRVIDELLGLLKEEHWSSVRDAAFSALQKLVEKQAREKLIRFPSPISQASVDTFFKEKQDLIKELAQKFSTYQNRTTPITEDTIKEWLSQFNNPSWMRLALKLLEEIDYYNSQRMKEIFRHFYENIIPEEDRSKVVVSLLGNLADSAALVNYFIGGVLTEYNLEKPQSLDTILNNMDPKEKVIVFVDDNIGSGKQAVQIFREWLGIEEKILNEHHVHPLSEMQKSRFKEFKIYLCTFVGFEEGKERVREELKEIGLNIGNVYSFVKSEEKIGCFHEAGDYFANPEEREEAKKMASEIGIQLFADKDWPNELKKERSLGYGNSQKLIVFFYNTPTSTLPILWKEGSYNGKSWQALFPRREKK